MSLLIVDVLEHVQLIINVILTAFAVYFTVMSLFSLLRDKHYKTAVAVKRIAVITAARNEELVLPNLIDSLKQQKYPTELFDIFVIPNNCTDNTESVAKAHGAKIYNCRYPVKSKGDALQQFFADILKQPKKYDAYCIFDADNVVTDNHLQKINDALCAGVKVGQGYRESKNPTDTLISGSYSIYYYMIDRFYNRARGVLDISCLINGSGFVVSHDIIAEFGGWHTKTMTEDIEFSTLCVLAGYKVEWIPQAKFFDEQPLTFAQSWRQRKRWTTGCFQGVERYGWRLLKKAVFKGSRSALDFLLFYLTPYVQVLCFGAFVNMGILSSLYWQLGMYNKIHVFIYLFYLVAFVLIGAATSILALKLEGKDYNKMYGSIFYYWFFIMSWIPINVICLFKRQTIWHPIAHTRVVSISETTNLF